MKLTKYLELKGEKPYQFAQRAGIGFELVYRLAKGEAVNLQVGTIQKIESATEQAVTYVDLVNP
jgi:predicted transcriptional regulator